MLKKQPKKLIDSRFLKVASVKKDELKNSFVFIKMNKKKYDKDALKEFVELLNEIEPNSVYFPLHDDVDIQFYSTNDFNRKNLLITIDHGRKNPADVSYYEDLIKSAIPNARSIKFVHKKTEIKDDY